MRKGTYSLILCIVLDLLLFSRVIITISHISRNKFYLYAIVSATGWWEMLWSSGIAALWTKSTLLINHCLPAGWKTTDSLIHPLCRGYLLLALAVFQLPDLSSPSSYTSFSLRLSFFSTFRFTMCTFERDLERKWCLR